MHHPLLSFLRSRIYNASDAIRIFDVRLVPRFTVFVQENLVDALEGDVGGFWVEKVDGGDEGELSVSHGLVNVDGKNREGE